MADGTIFDQTQETVLTAAHRVLVQKTSAATASTSATFGLMGGLETNNQTVTTTDITGAVGQLYVCTIAGLTAVRNLTLPSAQVGERIGVHIVDGDATYELVVKGAASQTINGGTAATEWSRLFIAGETCVFRCVAANTWIVEYDGRIPCKASSYCSTAVTTNSASVYQSVDFSANFTIDEDNASIVDSTNDVYRIRRAGLFNVSAGTRPNSNITANFSSAFSVDLSDTTSIIFVLSDAADTSRPGIGRTRSLPLTTGETLVLEWTNQEANKGLGADINSVFFTLAEVL